MYVRHGVLIAIIKHVLGAKGPDMAVVLGSAGSYNFHNTVHGGNLYGVEADACYRRIMLVCELLPLYGIRPYSSLLR